MVGVNVESKTNSGNSYYWKIKNAWLKKLKRREIIKGGGDFRMILTVFSTVINLTCVSNAFYLLKSKAGV